MVGDDGSGVGVTASMMVQGTLLPVNTFHSVEECVEGVHMM